MKPQETQPITAENGTMTRIKHEAEGAGGGAVAGAVFGSIAGPPGMVVGAVLGGAVGALAAAVLDSEDSRHTETERELDEEIGVTDGELGAPNLEHPRAKTGAFSAGSAGGASGSAGDPAEGPIQPL